MKVNATTWSWAQIIDFLAPYRGEVSVNDAVTWLTYYPMPKVA